MMAHVSAVIVSPKMAAEKGKDFGYSAEAVAGTGPYRIVRWRKDLELIIEPNEDYWGEKGKLDQVIYRPIPEAASRIIALESGDVDVDHAHPARGFEPARRGPRTSTSPRRSASELSSFGFTASASRSWIPRVRRAIAYAIDRRSIIDNLMPGMVVPSTGPLTPRLRGRADLGEFPYDPEKAKGAPRRSGLPRRLRDDDQHHRALQHGRRARPSGGCAARRSRYQSRDRSLRVGLAASVLGRPVAGGLPPRDLHHGRGRVIGGCRLGLATDLRDPRAQREQLRLLLERRVRRAHPSKRCARWMPTKRNALYRPRARDRVLRGSRARCGCTTTTTSSDRGRTCSDLTTSPLGLVTFEKAYFSSN